MDLSYSTDGMYVSNELEILLHLSYMHYVLVILLNLDFYELIFLIEF